MKIVIAMDSFKGTLKAHDACTVVSNVITKYLSDVAIVIKPMADGGEGTAKAKGDDCGGRWPLDFSYCHGATSRNAYRGGICLVSGWHSSC